MRLRLDLGYDGTYFHGWAKQDGLRTVQGELERALSLVLRQAVTLTVAGRTDAGVHALGQVAHFDLDLSRGEPGRRESTSLDLVAGSASALNRLRDRVNGLLAASYSMLWRPVVGRGMIPRAALVKGESDVQVAGISAVTEDFDARFSALGRRYLYQINDKPGARDPLLRNRQWWTPYSDLDVASMARSSAQFLRARDFLSFCKPREGATTIRTLKRLDVERLEGGGGPIFISVEADAFCHSMVRSLVGALVEVGRGAKDEDWVTALVRNPSRAHGVPIVPARGLTLVSVDYPPPAQWARRSAQSRRRRDCDCEGLG